MIIHIDNNLSMDYFHTFFLMTSKAKQSCPYIHKKLTKPSKYLLIYLSDNFFSSIIHTSLTKLIYTHKV